MSDHPALSMAHRNDIAKALNDGIRVQEEGVWACDEWPRLRDK